MQHGYLLFNKIIAAIMAAIIFYFGIYTFLGDYAVKCVVEQTTGSACIGCGLTRGINEALMLHFDKARQWNESSILILSFFIDTIVLRLASSLLVLKASSEKQISIILYTDLTVAILLFLFCFRHFFTTHLLK